jgi:hypothetical protein
VLISLVESYYINPDGQQWYSKTFAVTKYQDVDVWHTHADITMTLNDLNLWPFSSSVFVEPQIVAPQERTIFHERVYGASAT